VNHLFFSSLAGADITEEVTGGADCGALGGEEKSE